MIPPGNKISPFINAKFLGNMKSSKIDGGREKKNTHTYTREKQVLQSFDNRYNIRNTNAINAVLVSFFLCTGKEINKICR